MAITFRGTKGSSLTHNELDQNFREFFYSASYEGSNLKLHKFTSISSSLSIPLTNPVGRDGAIQFKLGSAVSGANAQFTGSQNLTFVDNNLKLTGSLLVDASAVGKQVEITGSAFITDNLTVGGTLTAEEFVTERNTTIQIYNSGSTIFGDSANDDHERTGSLKVLGAFNLDGSGSVTNLSGSFSGSFEGEGSGVTGIISSSYAVTASYSNNATSASYAITSSHAVNSLTASFALNADNGNGFPFEGRATISGSLIISGSGNVQEVTGSVDVSGSVTAHQFKATAGTGTPTLTSNNALILSASSHVQIKNAVLRVEPFANSETGSITPANGDIYYNSDRNAFIGYVNGAHTAFASAGAGLSNIVEDTTPQLGGNLDLNSNSISGSGTVDFVGNISSSNILLTGDINASSGSFTGPVSASAINASGDITAFFSSDERLKDNVTPIASALDKINSIGGYEFDWNSNSEHSGHDVGVIAQEIEKVLPEVVTTRGNGYKAVRYEKIVALLIQALKEQQSQIDDLKSRL